MNLSKRGRVSILVFSYISSTYLFLLSYPFPVMSAMLVPHSSSQPAFVYERVKQSMASPFGLVRALISSVNPTWGESPKAHRRLQKRRIPMQSNYKNLTAVAALAYSLHLTNNHCMYMQILSPPGSLPCRLMYTFALKNMLAVARLGVVMLREMGDINLKLQYKSLSQ
jgi:hypothetical protein